MKFAVKCTNNVAGAHYAISYEAESQHEADLMAARDGHAVAGMAAAPATGAIEAPGDSEEPVYSAFG